MKRLLTTACLLSSVLCSPSSGAELTDLGQGLSYLRVHSVGESAAAIRQALPGAGALVLDLRYATANGDSAGILTAALADHPDTAPLFILVSPATPAELGPAITQSAALTLGAPGSLPAPKVEVRTDAATDRRAYDALPSGTPLATLLSGKIEKERFDEAELVKEFKNGNTSAEPPPLPDPTAPKPAVVTAAPDARPVERLTDRVLQRAVHLHRALLVLRR